MVLVSSSFVGYEQSGNMGMFLHTIVMPSTMYVSYNGQISILSILTIHICLFGYVTLSFTTFGIFSVFATCACVLSSLTSSAYAIMHTRWELVVRPAVMLPGGYK